MLLFVCAQQQSGLDSDQEMSLIAFMSLIGAARTSSDWLCPSCAGARHGRAAGVAQLLCGVGHPAQQLPERAERGGRGALGVSRAPAARPGPRLVIAARQHLGRCHARIEAVSLSGCPASIQSACCSLCFVTAQLCSMSCYDVSCSRASWGSSVATSHTSVVWV